MSDQEHLIKEIKVLSDSIRKKNRKLKLGISKREDFIESTFKPVIQPLKDISQKIAGTPVKDAELLMPIKKFEGSASYKEEHEDILNTADEQDKDMIEDEEEEDEEEEDSDKPIEEEKESNLTVLGKDIASHGELFKKYVLKMLHGSIANRIYHVYGARLEKNGLMIGNKELEVDESDNIIVGNKTYPGTTGLFELIFKKLPFKYTAQDLRWFKDLCLTTNLHRKNYSPTGAIHRNNTKKYKTVIIKLFPVKTGSGIHYKNTRKPDIIYYNNINKLVERLKLLYEAQLAGHSGVSNEIIALTEELRQRGYIE